MKSSSNNSIRCTVDSCKHISVDGKHCSLSAISVGTHESHPTEVECTDCLSFELDK